MMTKTKAKVAAARWNVYDKDCPTRLVLDRIADKWTVLIVGLLATGTKRFGELRRDIGGISQKMLTQTLRTLERDGLVRREVFPTIPLRVEYTLTDLGATLIKALDTLAIWSEKNIQSVLAARRKYDQPPAAQKINASKVTYQAGLRRASR